MSWLLLGTLLATQVAATDDDRPSVIVLEFSHSQDIGQDASTTITGLATAGLAKNKALRIISGAEIRRLIDLEGDKEALGCMDESCLAEVAGALGARFAVSGRIAKLGNLIVLQMSLMDVRHAEGLSRVVHNAKGLEPFVLKMDALTKELLKPATARIAKERALAQKNDAAASDSGRADEPAHDAGPFTTSDPARQPTENDESGTPSVSDRGTGADGLEREGEPEASEPPPKPARRRDGQRERTNLQAESDDGSPWLLTGSLYGGGGALIALGVLAAVVVTPIDIYLAAVNPQLGPEDMIAPVVYVVAIPVVALGIALAVTPLFLDPSEPSEGEI